ncbi:MAG: hypothetical protein HUK07_02355 [Bacteroidaceae bacterium]|nr:hypothetical protein [Bacteroidaceae bacterium]
MSYTIAYVGRGAFRTADAFCCPCAHGRDCCAFLARPVSGHCGQGEAGHLCLGAAQVMG